MRRTETVACGSLNPTIQHLHDKLLRVEGRLGTALEKMQLMMEQVDEMSPKVGLLESNLLFVDVDKLNDAIGANATMSDLDPCFFATPEPLKQQLDALITPRKPIAPPLPALNLVANDNYHNLDALDPNLKSALKSVGEACI